MDNGLCARHQIFNLYKWTTTRKNSSIKRPSTRRPTFPISLPPRKEALSLRSPWIGISREWRKIEALANFRIDGFSMAVLENYTGDRLNFGLAAEQAKSEGYKVETVIVGDDCALPPPRGITGRRGLAGTILVHKVINFFLRKAKNDEGVVKISKFKDTSDQSKPGFARNPFTDLKEKKAKGKMAGDSSSSHQSSSSTAKDSTLKSQSGVNASKEAEEPLLMRKEKEVAVTLSDSNENSRMNFSNEEQRSPLSPIVFFSSDIYVMTGCREQDRESKDVDIPILVKGKSKLIPDVLPKLEAQKA
ncbi:hypothetical protein E5676_scaffold248G00260 [Cucumis melo var. makuwa]|uniref:DhaK domain-containing protein n=1 Tax=Cucumis melo var. makuwa TaxID=1194695 RepID=A0A5D3BKE0_CUCMM|nr:hypothetical protein E5676_scaffold248G00260 [Cucumis melo var. makuwa]